MKTRLFDENGYACHLIYKCISLDIEQNKFNKLRRKLIKRKLFYKFHIVVGDHCKIGLNLSLPHPQNIIIGNYAEIGENSKLFQDVTIGMKNIDGLGSSDKYPKIGNDCIIFSGAKILGGIVVEDGTIVGANSVLMKSTEKKSVYVGSPAISISGQGGK